MEIREASLADIPVIHKLAHTIWPVAYKDLLPPAQLAYMLELFYDPYQLQKQMEAGHRFIILYDYIYESKIPVGFASFSKLPAIESAFRLHKLYVLPRFQGKGAGKFLLDHIIAAVKNEGGSSLELNVNRNNEAQYFYHKMGFTIIREEDNDIGNGYFMNDYVMEKVIEYRRP